MDENTTVLPLTVHLLASSDQSSILQQAVDKFLCRICPDVRLFLVSERMAPNNQNESHRKRLAFPGISVTIFLREDLGEERISLLHGFFQLPPWNEVNTELKHVRSCPISQSTCDYYCLDVDMPVWGIRQVHYGMEIVRLTLYCNFDNYEDAVKLYELILQMEAIAQKPGFCFFALHGAKYASIQLSLKQLPPGVFVQVKEACALQFVVEAIGQLVPLLPYPCMPISDTRWQTQDYDGNKILLLVTENTKFTEGQYDCMKGQVVTSCTSNLSEFKTPNKRLESETHTDKAKLETCFTQSKSLEHIENSCGCRKKNYPKQSLYMRETETNVDTGYTVIKRRGHQSLVPGFSRSFTKLTISEDCDINTLVRTDCQKIVSQKVEAGCPEVLTRKICLDKGKSFFNLEKSQELHSNSKEQEEEFFI
ncbi:protein FAM124B [Pelobates fuscus]|uniref:protein FAM124B n=1 Tax=Pelobates fuscus TaxID=191477 RepID=UPI002FE45A1E